MNWEQPKESQPKVSQPLDSSKSAHEADSIPSSPVCALATSHELSEFNKAIAPRLALPNTLATFAFVFRTIAILCNRLVKRRFNDYQLDGSLAHDSGCVESNNPVTHRSRVSGYWGRSSVISPVNILPISISNSQPFQSVWEFLDVPVTLVWGYAFWANYTVQRPLRGPNEKFTR